MKIKEEGENQDPPQVPLQVQDQAPEEGQGIKGIAGKRKKGEESKEALLRNHRAQIPPEAAQGIEGEEERMIEAQERIKKEKGKEKEIKIDHVGKKEPEKRKAQEAQVKVRKRRRRKWRRREKRKRRNLKSSNHLKFNDFVM